MSYFVEPMSSDRALTSALNSRCAGTDFPGMALSPAVAAAAASAPPSLEPSAVEAPHALPRYTEPKPFVTGRALKTFGAAALVAGGCATVLYKLLANSISQLDQEQESAALPLRRRPAGSQTPVVTRDSTQVALPTFTSPSTFAELAQCNDSDFRVGTPSADPAVSPQPLLHQEAVHRVRCLWNDAIDGLEAAVVEMERQHRQYLRALALDAVRAQLESRYPGAEFTVADA